jgi:hypothetical protein
MPALLKDLHSAEKPCAVLLPSVPITGGQQGKIAMAKQPKKSEGPSSKMLHGIEDVLTSAEGA